MNIKFNKQDIINRLSEIISSDYEDRLFNKYIKGYESVTLAFFKPDNYSTRYRIAKSQIKNFSDSKLSKMYKAYLTQGVFGL